MSFTPPGFSPEGFSQQNPRILRNEFRGVSVLINRSFVLVLTFFLATGGLAWASNGLNSLIQEGQDLANQGKMDEAFAKLTTAVEQYPESSLAHTRLGGVRVLRQEYSLSIKDFQQAIMLDQKNSNAFVGLAVAYLHLGQFAHAKGALKEAEKLDPAKKEEITKLLTWIDKRSTGATGVH